jgi:putative copper resistance protein D
VEPDYALLQRAVTVALNLALAVLVGASAAGLWLRSMRSPWARALLPRLRKALLAACGAALAAHVAMLWIEAASMAEVPLLGALDAVRSVLTATHYGMAWMIGAVALLVTVAVSIAGGAASIIRIAAVGVLLYSRSMVSHAGAGGDLGWGLAVDWLHLVLVSLWVGEVMVAGSITLRRLPDHAPGNGVECARYVEALSRSATVALAGIVVTGAVSAWRVLGTPANLVGNPYGTTLLIKIGLVLCAAALGGFNRFVVMPSLLRTLHQTGRTQSDAGQGFARILQAEALFLAAAVVAAAFLTSTPPPGAS